MRGGFDVCVLGSLNLDLVVRSPRLPSGGETLLGGPFERHPGGKGANQAVAAARMGARVAMIGAVGDDEAGERLLGVLRAEGVDVTHVARRAGVASGIALITVAESGENSIVVAPGANATVSPAEVEAARGAIERSACLLAQLEVPIETVAHAFALARAAGVRTILNAAPARVLPAALLAASDVLVVNQGEARTLSGPSIADFGFVEPTGGVRTASVADANDLHVMAQACADDLLECGPQLVFVTLGSHGAIASGAQDGRGRGAFAVDAVDTTGAGDAFVGAVAHALAAGFDLERVLDEGCAAGALACTVRGAIPSLPDRAAVEALVSRNK